ncbi:hypothetical protein [Flavobacterium sp. SLB02]|nr:hypothetical protein [Flavobacterium sp. SLB02]
MFTKIAKDWELKHFETFPTRSEACKRELQIKKNEKQEIHLNLNTTKG